MLDFQAPTRALRRARLTRPLPPPRRHRPLRLRHQPHQHCSHHRRCRSCHRMECRRTPRRRCPRWELYIDRSACAHARNKINTAHSLTRHVRSKGRGEVKKFRKQLVGRRILPRAIAIEEPKAKERHQSSRDRKLIGVQS